MRNKKNLIINIILSIITPVVIIIITASVIHAWYTNTIQTGELNASTQNVAVEYTINNGTEKNVLTYNITNLAFFDADSDEEGKYLNTMAFRMDLKIKNNSTNAVSYSVEFESTKSIIDQVSIAYCACIYDSVSVTSTKKCVNDFIEDATQTNDKFTNIKEGSSNLATNAETTVSLFVFGIQEIDLASSDDFLYTQNRLDTRTYTFKLTIKAEPNGSPIIEENTD